MFKENVLGEDLMPSKPVVVEEVIERLRMTYWFTGPDILCQVTRESFKLVCLPLVSSLYVEN